MPSQIYWNGNNHGKKQQDYEPGDIISGVPHVYDSLPTNLVMLAADRYTLKPFTKSSNSTLINPTNYTNTSKTTYTPTK
jgi:hypothetical protein